MTEYPQAFLDLLHSVTAKRPKTVIDHILAHGCITTQELQEVYGYDHPPRAIRDVREYGIPIVTERIKDENGKTIAAYRFGSPDEVQHASAKAAGRTSLSKALKQALLDKYGSRCAIYLEEMDASLLQIDHRVPYEISGEANTTDVDCFMLLSPSANQAKSWACEHCDNWKAKDKAFCLKCFWAHPEAYEHIAGQEARAIALLFTGEEVEDYNRLIERVGAEHAQAFIKHLLHEQLM